MSSTASSQPDRKRPRVSEDTEEKALVNHPTLYFDDGNVILSSGRTLFRVHRSLLSKYSPVFRETFECKADRRQESLRGCLHVVLHDNSEEVQALLNVIYDGLRIDFPRLTIENFPTLSNIFRMATKYKIDRPRTEILDCIQQEWPFTLEKHDAKTEAFRREQAQLSPFIVQGGKFIVNPQYNPTAAQHEDLLVHPAGVIALLRQGGCTSPEVLTPLFYALSRQTWQFGGPAVGHHIAPLSHGDIERFIVGLERLRNTHAASATRCPTLGIPHYTANQQLTCTMGIQHYWSDLATTLTKMTTGMRQPIEDWKDLITLARLQGSFVAYSICGECSRALVAEMEAIRMYIWSQLPTFFELV